MERLWIYPNGEAYPKGEHYPKDGDYLDYEEYTWVKIIPNGEDSLRMKIILEWRLSLNRRLS